VARSAPRAQKIYTQFLNLSPRADAYYKELATRRLNAKVHVQKIVALSEIYGADKVALALEDAFTFQAFSSEYIANILESRARALPIPSALHLTRRSDLLEIDLPAPDLSIYNQGDPDDQDPKPWETTSSA